MGKWNQEIMNLSGLERFFAKNLLGGKVFGSANWGDAVRYMEQAVAVEPERITHHLDLARIYVDVGQKAKARAEYEKAIALAPTDPNDDHRKRDAAAELKKL
jgi:Flp pilus assembly protein TadD